MNKRLEAAQYTFAKGYNCAQSVFIVFADEFGLSHDLGLRVASAMGGGIARRQETCGAVTGALMALGLKYGMGENGTDEDKKHAYALSQQLIKDFEAVHGSINCLQLLGGNRMDTEEGRAAIASEDMHATRCSRYIETAVALAEKMLHEER